MVGPIGGMSPNYGPKEPRSASEPDNPTAAHKAAQKLAEVEEALISYQRSPTPENWEYAMNIYQMVRTEDIMGYPKCEKLTAKFREIMDAFSTKQPPSCDAVSDAIDACEAAKTALHNT